MPFVTLNCTLNDVPEDADSVVLASANGSYGIINATTGAVAVPTNTPVLHYLTGVYQYDVSALANGTTYQVSWQITYQGNMQYVTETFTPGTPPQLADIKTYLRIDPTDTAFDTEIQDLINAAVAELREVGVSPDILASGDTLIRKAITTYCKANFGYDTDNAVAFDSSYQRIKIFLMNNADYQQPVVFLGPATGPMAGW